MRVYLLPSCLMFLAANPATAEDPEDRAVAFVQKLGGTVECNPKAMGNPIIKVSLRISQATDAGLRELAPLKQLQSLDLSCTRVSDAGLNALVPFANLQELNLNLTYVTDEGMKSLSTLKQLRKLQLAAAEVTDVGLKELAELKQL